MPGERKTIRLIVLVSLTLISLSFTSPVRADTASSWSAAKNAADDRVYFDRRVTLYCGCTFVSDGDSDGSGDVDPAAYGLTPLPKQQKTAKWIEWEHIVPASLTPARDFACWEQPKRFKSCIDKDGESIRGRECCERVLYSSVSTPVMTKFCRPACHSTVVVCPSSGKSAMS